VRLIGVRLPPWVTSGENAYVALSQVSALVGRNDVGKSRILRAIADGLAPSDGCSESPRARPTLYVELDDSPLRWLDAALDAPSGGRHDHVVTDTNLFGRVLPPEGSSDFFRLFLTHQDDAGASGASVAEARLAAQREAVGLDNESWDPLFDRLRESRFASLRPVGDLWALDWCLAAEVAREREVAAALIDLGLSPPETDSEPIVVAPLLPWLTTGKGLPPVRALPARLDEVDQEVRSALQSLCSADRPAGVDGPTFERFVLRLFTRLVTDRLPPFIRDAYEPSVAGGIDRVEIEFVLRKGDARLPPAAMADGFKIWVELALRDAQLVATGAVARLTKISRNEAALPERAEAARAHLFLYDCGNDVATAIRQGGREAVDVFAEVASLLTHEEMADEAYTYVGTRGSVDLSITVGTRTHGVPLFVIDEPERHLHPSLERQAARWLGEVGRSQVLHGQVLMATHSVAMMSLPRPSLYTFVRRDLGVTRTSPLPPEAMDELDVVSDELGLDRGELITGRRVFAYVEGEVDRLVFQTLFADRLRDAGVQLVPLHGLRNAPGIVEADILFRLAKQRIAVIVDNVVREKLPPSDDQSQLKRLANRHKGTELGTVAQLLLNATFREQTIAVFAIPGPDIIAELDDDVLREVLKLPYPGFAASMRYLKDSNSELPWKRFCIEKQWLRDDPDSIGDVVRAMKELPRTPPNLETIVAGLEALSEQL
jgi:hypothetical protein